MSTNAKTNGEWIDETADELDLPLSVMEPRSQWDAAIVGVSGGITIYDLNMVIDILEASGMDRDEAWEFHQFNQQSLLWEFMQCPPKSNLEKEYKLNLDRLREDPDVVHTSMLRHQIARLSDAQVKHLYPHLFEL